MSNWWQPTAETYLGRVSKDQIIEALREPGKNPKPELYEALEERDVKYAIRVPAYLT